MAGTQELVCQRKLTEYLPTIGNIFEDWFVYTKSHQITIAMKRREFLGTLTAPVAVACTACMAAACSKSSDGPNNAPTPPSNVNFTVNLSTQLLAVGSSLSQSGVIVARLAAQNQPNSFVAVQESCTHQGTNINFSSGNNQFICPNHGAIFNTSGANVGGQSTGPLKVYAIAINGTTLTVTG
jgi:Rieske Fe-S protein